MGTNYYFQEKPPCECCGRAFNMRHIGKSSGGWCFSLRVYPDEGINELADWIKLWSTPGSRIEDEYGDVVTTDEMLAAITDRCSMVKKRVPYGYTSLEEFHRRNDSQDGPNGLFRSRIGSRCIGHGIGTYDLIVGEFS